MAILMGKAFQCTADLERKTILAVIGRSADLSVCQRVDEFALPAIGCEIVS